MDTHLCFRLGRDEVRSGILIPKYYDPELILACESAGDDYETPRIAELLESGAAGSQLGDWIRREHYGTGEVPYVRTSDLAHWRIRADYKKGVSADVYESLREKQDIRAGDLLMVAHGTYLVGNCAIVRAHETELVLQDHVFRLRPNGVEPELLLAALSTTFVRRQLRACQFSADIIDKLGNRHLDVRVPLPRSPRQRQKIAAEVRSILDDQDSTAAEILDLSGGKRGVHRERSEAHFGFTLPRAQIRNRILIPKYYDPDVAEEIASLEATGVKWVSIGQLVADGRLDVGTGVEVGKLAYGTGSIPFVRTSDIALWEIRHDAKHSVSEAVYEAHGTKGRLGSGDIILVRDGTYLVGSSAFVVDDDLPAMFCGGMYRLRPGEDLDGRALLGSLNLPAVRRQMRAKQFTRDVIDTLGKRLFEVRIPDPDSAEARQVAKRVAAVVETRAAAKRKIREVVAGIEPPIPEVARGRPGWSMR